MTQTVHSHQACRGKQEYKLVQLYVMETGMLKGGFK